MFTFCGLQHYTQVKRWEKKVVVMSVFVCKIKTGPFCDFRIRGLITL